MKTSQRISIDTAWQERLKIRERTTFKDDTLNVSEDIALQTREILQTFVCWGHELAATMDQRL